VSDGADGREGADEFELRHLQEDDSFNSLRTGDERFAPLKMFARKNAKRYEAESLARTYVIVDVGQRRIAAYITLVCSEISAEDLVRADGLHFPYPTYPAVKIARLLVDERYRDRRFGFGRKLVNLAQGIATDEIAPSAGCRFVVVDSKAEAIEFYERCGFTLLDTPENRSRPEAILYLDLHKAV
jgi:GNAT superfamily N-acetyltransferase